LCLQCSPQFLSIQSCSHSITRSERNTSCVAVRTERSVRLPVHNVPRNVAVHTCCVRRCCSRKVLSDPLCTLLFIPSGPSLCVHALPEGRIGCLGEQLRAARHLPGAETPHIPNARIPRLVAWHAFCSRGGIRFRAVVAVVACMAVDFDRGGHKNAHRVSVLAGGAAGDCDGAGRLAVQLRAMCPDWLQRKQRTCSAQSAAKCPHC
jgi:hypothetical protein